MNVAHSLLEMSARFKMARFTSFEKVKFCSNLNATIEQGRQAYPHQTKAPRKSSVDYLDDDILLLEAVKGR